MKVNDCINSDHYNRDSNLIIVQNEGKEMEKLKETGKQTPTHGLARTSRMRTAISPGRWQPWTFSMLMSPNKGETAVHGCHCTGDLAVRMRKVLAKLNRKLFGKFYATFEIFSNFCDFRQLLKFWATFDFF